MSDRALFRLFDGLPRQGPGSEAATLEALRRLPPLPMSARVLDLGCGTGRQTLVLARALDAVITAVDFHAPFLAHLDAAAAAEGLAPRIRTRCADFGALDEPPGSYDLLWSEGAVYRLGWAEGLRCWRPLLRPGGLAALTELTWLVDAPPAEAAAFWREGYPAMGALAADTAAARRAGYEVLDTFALPPSAWWDEYYRPLEARIAALREESAADLELAAVLDETAREIELYARFGDTYGYVFYLLRAA